MLLKPLLPQEQECIAQALRFLAFSNYLWDVEFDLRTDFTRQEFTHIVNRWPDLDDRDRAGDDAKAIKSALVEVCYGERIWAHTWQKWFTCSQEEVRLVYEKWHDG